MTQSSGGKSICQKLGGRLYEFDAHLGSAGLFGADVDDAALARSLRGFIGDGYFLGGSDAGGEGNEGAVGVDDQRAGIFVEILIGRRFAFHRDRHAEQYTHTAAAAGIGDELLRVFLWSCKCAHVATIAAGTYRGNGTIFLFVIFSYWSERTRRSGREYRRKYR